MVLSDAQRQAMNNYDKKTQYDRQKTYIKKMRNSGEKHSVYFSMNAVDYENLKDTCKKNNMAVAEVLRTLAKEYSERGGF